jgi:hypothetical protein
MIYKVIDSVLDPVRYQVSPMNIEQPLLESEDEPNIDPGNQLAIPAYVKQQTKVNNKRILSFNTILEENKEYDQSSVCNSANHMSQF